jgi:hypothetical protein
MFADLNMLDRALKSDPKQSNNWRTSPEYFQSVEGGLKCGTLNISPAWFEQGHEVFRCLSHVCINLISTADQRALPEGVVRSYEREPDLRVVEKKPVVICIDGRYPQHSPTGTIQLGCAGPTAVRI